MSAYNSRGVLATRNLPLHKIPHYYFSSVAGSTKSLLIFIFFPELHLESQQDGKRLDPSVVPSHLRGDRQQGRHCGSRSIGSC
ncbi:hypothetical protein PMIN02_012401 [Paraphaeosphaeria minitans]